MTRDIGKIPMGPTYCVIVGLNALTKEIGFLHEPSGIQFPTAIGATIYNDIESAKEALTLCDDRAYSWTACPIQLSDVTPLKANIKVAIPKV